MQPIFKRCYDHHDGCGTVAISRPRADLLLKCILCSAAISFCQQLAIFCGTESGLAQTCQQQPNTFSLPDTASSGIYTCLLTSLMRYRHWLTLAMRIERTAKLLKHLQHSQ